MPNQFHIVRQIKDRVYEASGDIAVKVAVRRDVEAAAALKRETLALRACKAAHVPHVVDIFEAAQGLQLERELSGRVTGLRKPIQQKGLVDVLAVQMLHGASLQERLDMGDLLNEAATRQLAKNILETLDALHEKVHITHGNIQASNVMLENGEVILIDFGACSVGDDYQADLRSLGVLLYHATTGNKPWAGQSHFILPASLNPGAQDFISSLLGPQRPSAKQALQHPWLQEQSQEKPNFELPKKGPIYMPHELALVVRSQAGAFSSMPSPGVRLGPPRH